MAARAARVPGRPAPGAPEISPAEAFGRAADALFGLLCTLDDAQWQAPVLRDLDVQGLVGHLVGVERDVHRALAGDPSVAQSDHVASTQSVAEEQVGVPPHATLQSWREAADHTLRLVAARVRPDELELRVTGAVSRLDDVVASAAALALD
jgi:hypothetical protein